ncbi:MAG: UDP-glucose 4-epimerase GalE [Thermoguttaceae bacterium]|nr:UDP-glucose 4-epimerase GalE [Thermoguttaceae bacterium]
MATVLLTGGSGYIGSHTAVEFMKAGVDVVVIDNLSNSSREALDRAAKLANSSAKLYEIDACDKEAVRAVFAENKIDAVVHFAGYKAVGESVAQPLKYYHNNIDSALTICELMREFNVPTIVFSSSATVYGTSQNVPLKETEPTGCTNPYGWTKLFIEQILTDFAAATPGVSVTLLRYFNPVGAHPSGDIGEDPLGIPNNLAPYVCQVAVGRREKLSVFGNDYPTPDGTGVRDYIHVVDLAKGHLAAYRCAKPGVNIYNLGTGCGYSVLDLVNAFEKVNGVKIPYEITPRRPGDVATCYADPTRANEELGWKAELTLDDMCRDAYNWQTKNPNGYRSADE